jgi:hypothetical protein
VPVPNIAQYQAAVKKETNLISYYTFDADDASDWKGSNTGSVEGSAIFDTGLGGGANKALVLDGLGQVSFGPVADFDFAGGTGTIEAWIRADWVNVAYNPCLFAARDGGSVSWSIHMTAGKDVMGDWNGANYLTLPLIDVGQAWHHFAMAFGSNRWTMYFDGESLGTVNQSIGAIPDAPTQIGSVNAASTAEGWVGAVDEVAFYRATLEAEAIRSHYQALVGVPAASPALAFLRSGNQLKLSWPSDTTGFILETVEKLSGAAWMPVNGVSNNAILIGLSDASRFYRLRKP